MCQDLCFVERLKFAIGVHDAEHVEEDQPRGQDLQPGGITSIRWRRVLVSVCVNFVARFRVLVELHLGHLGRRVDYALFSWYTRWTRCFICSQRDICVTVHCLVE